MKNRGIVLLSNLYSCARDIARSVRPGVLAAEDGTKLLGDAIYKCDALSVVTYVFDRLQSLLSIRRNECEGFQNYEQRLWAQPCKFNSVGNSFKLINEMAALYLLANANTNSAQRLSILAFVASADPSLSPRATLDSFIQSVAYERSLLSYVNMTKPNQSMLVLLLFNSDLSNTCPNG